MNQMPVRVEFAYNKIGSYCGPLGSNPFTIAFCYPKKGQSFIVKGGLIDVRKYLTNLTIPCIVHLTYFKHGRSRTQITVYGLKPSIRCHFGLLAWPKENKIYSDMDVNYKEVLHITKKVRNVARRTLMVYRETNGLIFEKKLRHIPRCWMKELDQFVA